MLQVVLFFLLWDNNSTGEFMKKGILTFCFCFLLTMSQAIAECTCKPECQCSPTCSCDCKTKLKNAKYSSYKPREIFADDLKFNRNFADQVKKERAAVSNALGLTEEQAKCRVEMTRKNTVVLQEKFRTLYDENYKLKVLKAENAAKNAIKAQEDKINCIKKEIKAIVEQENKEFNKILDRDQRAKLRMIQKLQRKAMKESTKQKNYYKSNPKMRPFAMPEKQNCDCVTGELE